MARFTGVMTALVTPFHDDGSLDLDSYRGLIKQQLDAGVTGLVPCGTTGEASTMTQEEHLLVVKTCKEAVAGKVPRPVRRPMRRRNNPGRNVL